MKIIAKLITAFWLIALTGYGQTNSYKAEILAASKKLITSASYSVEMHYQLFLDNNLDAPFQERKVKMLRKGSNFYANQSQRLEIIDMGRYQVYIDHKDKMIAALSRPLRDKSLQRNELVDEMSEALDTILKVTSRISKLKEDNNSVTYELGFKPTAMILKVIVVLDKKNGFYRSITTTYAYPQKIKELNDEEHLLTLKIDYKGLSSNPVVKPELFDVKNYLVLDNKGLIEKPSQKFNQYKYYNGKS